MMSKHILDDGDNQLENENLNTDDNAVEDEAKENDKEDNQKIRQKKEQESDVFAALEQEISELKDKLLRTVAESENMRKRYERQIDETRDFAINKFAKDLLGPLDTLTKVLELKVESNENEELKNFMQGIEMTCREFESLLEKHGIVKINPQVGEKFDYNTHQAVAQVKNDSPQGTIVNVLQAGYKLKDRLLRAATVTVSGGEQ